MVRDKRRPWLDYDGSLELAKQAKIKRENREKVKCPRNKYLAIFLLVGWGCIGLHRFYLYDSKMGWRIMKLFFLFYFMLIFSFLIFRVSMRSDIGFIFDIVLLLVFGLFIAKELPYVLKRTKEINKDILSYD